MSTLTGSAADAPTVLTSPPTLSEVLAAETSGPDGPHEDLAALVERLAGACVGIAEVLGRGALAGLAARTGTVNVQGEQQAGLDLLADRRFAEAVAGQGLVAGLVSEERATVQVVEPGPAGEGRRGRYLISFDPLDGSSNIDTDVSVGSIFSIQEDPDPAAALGPEAFLQPGRRQVAAGYALYGPSTLLVLSLGRGTHGFTLDRQAGRFLLTHPDLRVPSRAAEFAINASNARFWEPAVTRYVEECLAGASGPRGRDFNMRWVASLVAEAHRVLIRGGVFLYPRDGRSSRGSGKLRLLYEADPIGFLIEQAGGRASDGERPVLDVQPRSIHERTGLVFGSAPEVERIEAYHRDHNVRPFDAPLFGVRGLFRRPA
ncbi:MAG TPA: class 1 fructose-bisphosphatase [Candidatus Limnocylindrales bacterium]|nr:class 1 fructose-bisphosphatase [Candidatus Limnocylindrales bacterium]